LLSSSQCQRLSNEQPVHKPSTFIERLNSLGQSHTHTQTNCGPAQPPVHTQITITITPSVSAKRSVTSILESATVPKIPSLRYCAFEITSVFLLLRNRSMRPLAQKCVGTSCYKRVGTFRTLTLCRYLFTIAQHRASPQS
jgi:hypothetical protein